MDVNGLRHGRETRTWSWRAICGEWLSPPARTSPAARFPERPRPAGPQRGAASGAGSRPRVACGLRRPNSANSHPSSRAIREIPLSGAESTMSTTPPFEIPTDMRKVTSQSMEQARTAINGFSTSFRAKFPAISWAAPN